jgi:hypothetical protein
MPFGQIVNINPAIRYDYYDITKEWLISNSIIYKKIKLSTKLNFKDKYKYKDS